MQETFGFLKLRYCRASNKWMRVFIHKHESLASMKYEMESKCHNNLGQPPTFDSNNSICALCCMYPFVHKTDMEPYRHAVTNKEASLQVECDGRNPYYPCHRAWGAGSRSWVISGFSLRRAPCSKSRALPFPSCPWDLWQFTFLCLQCVTGSLHHCCWVRTVYRMYHAGPWGCRTVS